MKPAPFEYVRAASLSDALSRKAQAGPDSRYLAGGQSLGPMLNLRLARPRLLVDISRLRELRETARVGGHVRIGAGVTHAEIEDGLDPDPSRGLLSHAAREIAWRAIRNRGTIGGNVAHADPLGDWAPALFALGAKVLLESPRGTRELPIERFVQRAFATVLEEDEILRSIGVPQLSEESAWGIRRISRKKGDYAEAIGVVVADPRRGMCRVVLGGVEPAPRFLCATAAALAAKGTAAALEALPGEIAEVFPEADAVERKIRHTAVVRAIGQAVAPE